MASCRSDEFLIDTALDFQSELFPEINQSDPLEVDQNNSNGFSGCDSDDASSFIDVGEPEHILNTQTSSEADKELVSYLTGTANPQLQPERVKLVRVFNNNVVGKTAKSINGNSEARVMKIDSAGNRRMLQAIRVVNPTRRQSSGDDSLATVDSYSDYLNQPSLSKSAIAARENREKKKKYMADLERAVKDLSTQNKQLKGQNETYARTTDNLQREVKYLKSVLINQSTLSKLLNNIPGIPDISLSSKISPIGGAAIKRQQTSDLIGDRTSTSPATKRLKSNALFDAEEETYLSDKILGDSSGGVCLHVSGNAVSLEFCARCNDNATVSHL